ncbi:hypothetical protein TeGR_g11606 [Tetraparma gracilis]|uniref:Band 7 domain-containing protein n=1 Tax=Tetraparma gracilis TaxID=2962635 RepID=A0ABQ6M401_9STRA|nr:hypothetical protein TeGR_g11606 [Tetraparma gracilis]
MVAHGQENWDRTGAMERAKKFYFILGTLCLIICPILFGCSFATISPGTVALRWNKNVNNVDTDTLYKPGRYFVGLGVSFLKFPIFYQDVKMSSVSARTGDGLTVSILPSFQYKLPVDSIDSMADLYMTYGMSYQATIESIALSSLRDVMATFNAYELVSDREHVADTLQTDLDSRTKPQMKVEIVGFQLLSVSWDAQIDSKIMEAVVAFEDIKTAYAEKNISAIEADTSVFQAQIMSESVTIEATRVAAILTASKQADADIITLQGTAQSEAYAAVKSSISGLDEDALLKYVYLDQVVGGDYGKKKLSLDVPAEVKAAMDAL